jgi:hypothetical protein
MGILLHGTCVLEEEEAAGSSARVYYELVQADASITPDGGDGLRRPDARLR